MPIANSNQLRCCDQVSPWTSYNYRADSTFASSQWATALLCNDVCRWLGASLESALMIMSRTPCTCVVLSDCWPFLRCTADCLLFVCKPVRIINKSDHRLNDVSNILFWIHLPRNVGETMMHCLKRTPPYTPGFKASSKSAAFTLDPLFPSWHGTARFHQDNSLQIQKSLDFKNLYYVIVSNPL